VRADRPRASSDGSVREISTRWTLTVPDSASALSPSDQDEPAGNPSPVGARAADRVGRRVLRLLALLLATGSVIATTVPIARTVTLQGRLVPARTVSLRVEEPGVLTDVHVAVGDTVRPGQLVARLWSPELDEALRTAPAAGPTLLARQARLDLYAPPWAERRPNGHVDPSTISTGGLVLTEDLREQRGARFDTGDVVLDLAMLGTDGRIPFVVHAWADGRDAQRVRPGMPARLTFSDLPPERPRQSSGAVRYVGPAPEDHLDVPTPEDRWRVEATADTDGLAAVLASMDPAGRVPRLRVGFVVEVAIEERRETLAQTAWRIASANGNR
jgi:hypothetical protein